MSTKGIFKPLLPRLMKSVTIASSGCWEWNRAISTGTGYGNISVGGMQIGAHRASYIAHYGEIANCLCVCHRCDNRKCINPEHLFLGTKLENIQDAKAKGRLRPHRFANGERHNKGKLSEREVIEILVLIASRNSRRSIAARYGVNPSSIWQIASGKSWKYITGAA